MRDRTLIILAVLFLTFSISSGVNKSLEAGNLKMGRPMAPDLKQLYNSNIPFMISYLKEFGGSFEHTKNFVTDEIKTQADLWRDSFEKAYSKVKSELQDKKNIVAR